MGSTMMTTHRCHVSRHRLRAVLLFALALFATTVQGAQTAQRNARPYSRFKIPLTGIVNDTLPFDVPFIVWGDVPATVHTVRLWYAALPRNGETCEGDLKYQEVGSATARTWTAQEYADRGIVPPRTASSSPERQVEFLLEPLRARQEYCLLFQQGPGRDLTDREATRLRQQILATYESFLRDNTDTLRDGENRREVERLRQRLIDELLGSGVDGFVPDDDSIFDRHADPEKVYVAFIGLFQPVLARNTAVQDEVEIFRNRVYTAQLRWERWADGPSLTNLRDDLSQSNRAFVDRFVMAGPEGRRKRLAGSTRDDWDRMADDLWDPDPSVTEQPRLRVEPRCPQSGALGARCRRLRADRQQLEALQVANGSTSHELATGVTETIADFVSQEYTVVSLQWDINQRDAAMRSHVEELSGLVRNDVRAFITTNGTFATRRAWYLGAEVGLGMAPDAGEVLPYVGTSIYFRPVNTEAELRLATRVSALLGVTWTDNVAKRGERAGLYGDSGALVVGVGARVTEVIKVGVGVLVLKVLDPNPLLDRSRIGVTPFFTLSGDFDVAKILGGLFGGDGVPSNRASGSN